jgi:hypothetical protein
MASGTKKTLPENFYDLHLKKIIDDGVDDHIHNERNSDKRKWAEFYIEKFLLDWSRESDMVYADVDNSDHVKNIVLAWKTEEDSVSLVSSIHELWKQNPTHQLFHKIRETQALMRISRNPDWVTRLSQRANTMHDIENVLEALRFNCLRDFVSNSELNAIYYGLSERGGILGALSFYHTTVLKTPEKEIPVSILKNLYAFRAQQAARERNGGGNNGGNRGGSWNGGNRGGDRDGDNGGNRDGDNGGNRGGWKGGNRMGTRENREATPHHNQGSSRPWQDQR